MNEIERNLPDKTQTVEASEDNRGKFHRYGK